MLPTCLKAGLSIFEFWDLTLAELTIVLNNYKETQEQLAKEKIALNYNQAVMIADFVNLRLHGKKLPSYNELFPEAQPREQDKDKEYKRMMLLKEQFASFARMHNKNRHKNMGGDGL